SPNELRPPRGRSTTAKDLCTRPSPHSVPLLSRHALTEPPCWELPDLSQSPYLHGFPGGPACRQVFNVQEPDSTNITASGHSR
ncbi:hypothetical protein NDU88_007711, partial [Pleurodeles waltl]